jgi:hypothetical protein
MIVDCDRCEVRGDACGDCVITVLLGSPPGGVELDGTERRALENLAAAGLVPGLQLVRSDERHDLPCGGSGCGPGGKAQRTTDCAERSVRRVS